METGTKPNGCIEKIVIALIYRSSNIIPEFDVIVPTGLPKPFGAIDTCVGICAAKVAIGLM